MSGRVTIKTIADAVGVTHGTVSRALRGDPRVKAATAVEVRDMAERLGYRPSRLARALKTQQTGTLAIVVSYIHDPFYSEVVQAVHDRLFPMEYNLVMAATESDLLRQQRVAQSFLEHSVDGVFVCCLPGLTPPFQRLRSQIPLVTINCDPSLHAAGVYHNDPEAIRQTIDFLVRRGHRHIGYVGAENGGFAQRERLKAFTDESRKLSIEQTVLSCPDVKIEIAYAEADKWLAQGKLNRPTAMVCFNDTVAMGFLKACREHQVSVPDELSIVGFDDIEMADFLYPGLTTFSQPRYEMGKVATETMMALLSGLEEGSQTKFLGNLVQRGTVGNVP